MIIKQKALDLIMNLSISNDCLHKVFKFLSFSEYKLNKEVCKKWNNIMKEKACCMIFKKSNLTRIILII